MKFGIVWKAVQEKYVAIEADSGVEALAKFNAGEYDTDAIEINDEDMLPEYLGGYTEVIKED